MRVDWSLMWDGERRRLLAGIRELLAPEGLLVLCTRSLEYVDAGPSQDAMGGRVRRAFRVLANHTPAWTAEIVAGLPRRISNRRRLRPFERRTDGYAIINDSSQNHGLLQYHVVHGYQLAQLEDLGYEVLECLDLDGWTIEPGERPRTPHLH